MTGQDAGVAPPCVFCEIVAGEAPAHVVLDDDVAVAFLDVRPLFPGHVLLVPRPHVVTLPELPAGQVGPLFERAQALAAAVVDGLGARLRAALPGNLVAG